MTIGIIAAMKEEIKLLEAILKEPKEHEIADQRFSIGKLNEKEIVLLQCGIGKVNAAIGTTLLNQLYQPKYIINTGVAGATGRSLNIGDIAISSKVCYHDVDLTAFGYKFGQMAQMHEHYSPSNDLIKIASVCSKQLSGYQAKKTLILSGDSFISNPEQINRIKKHFTEDFAIEMEAGAIAQTCYIFDTPFIIIRSISDIIGEDNKTNYENFLPLAAKRSADFVFTMLQHLT
jgi:adenosylhomocysteine nucleosidase